MPSKQSLMFPVVFAVVIAFILSACSGSTDKKNSTTDSSTKPSASSDQQATTGSSASDGPNGSSPDTTSAGLPTVASNAAQAMYEQIISENKVEFSSETVECAGNEFGVQLEPEASNAILTVLDSSSGFLNLTELESASVKSGFEIFGSCMTKTEAVSVIPFVDTADEVACVEEGLSEKEATDAYLAAYLRLLEPTEGPKMFTTPQQEAAEDKVEEVCEIEL